MAARLERMFQARGGGGADAIRPRFARHAEHVRAVMAQGGYPTLTPREAGGGEREGLRLEAVLKVALDILAAATT